MDRECGGLVVAGRQSVLYLRIHTTFSNYRYGASRLSLERDTYSTVLCTQYQETRYSATVSTLDILVRSTRLKEPTGMLLV